MATKLNKIVTRETTMIDRKGRIIIVSLLPNNLLSFRCKGSSKSVEIGLGHCHVLAEIIEENHYHKTKMKEYKEKKKAGLKTRKPSKLKLVYSTFYSKAL